MKEKPKRKLGWRLLRWGFIGLAVLVTLAAVLVTEENWRAKRDWENYKLAAAARGERLDMASVIPPAVPDEQNFFCAPIVAEAFYANLKSAQAESNQGVSTNWEMYSIYKGRFGGTEVVNRMNFSIYRGHVEMSPNDFKMTNWQAYFRKFNETPEGKTNGFPVPSVTKSPAEDVLFGLSQFDSALEELRQAAARPTARMPLDFDKGFDNVGQLLPWLAQTKRCGQFLNLRIRAELEAGLADKALADIKLFQRITEANSSEPLLITELVRIAMLSILQDALIGSIQQHRWTDAQLAEIQTIIAKEDVLVSFATGLEREKIYAIDEFEKQRITRQMRATDEHDGIPLLITNSLRGMPDAYFYRNQLAFAEMHQKFIVPLVDFTNRIIAPTKTREIQARAEKESGGFSLYHAQAAMVYPAISSGVAKFARVQAKLDMTRVACALERFRLAHGNYPDTLDALTPKYIEALPHDIINGKPLNYRRATDDKILLYSVGWNETDDGGKTATTKKGAADWKNGDWVWP